MKHHHYVKHHPHAGLFERLAARATAWTGTTWALALAVGSVALWALAGPLCAYSDTWMLVINTLTTIITFVMVFLIQRTQNKEALAFNIKLNELIAAVEGASNRLINVEDLTEQEVEALHRRYHKLVLLAKHEQERTCVHTIEEARSHPHLAVKQPVANGAQSTN